MLCYNIPPLRKTGGGGGSVKGKGKAYLLKKTIPMYPKIVLPLNVDTTWLTIPKPGIIRI